LGWQPDVSRVTTWPSCTSSSAGAWGCPLRAARVPAWAEPLSALDLTRSRMRRQGARPSELECERDEGALLFRSLACAAAQGGS